MNYKKKKMENIINQNVVKKLLLEDVLMILDG